MALQLDEFDLKNLWGRLHTVQLRHKVAIGLAIWALVLLGFFMLSWRGLIMQMHTNHAEIADRHQRLDAQSALLVNRVAIQQELLALEARLPALQRALPTDREMASLLDKINQMLRKQSLVLNDFTPKSMQDQEVMRLLPVTLSADGRGPDMARVPLNLARLSRQVRLANFEMVEQPNTGQWRLTGELHAFAQLGPVATKPASQEGNPDD
ncbi:type 4a pilus biogenesis protein PilO [Limnobacter sp.]|uniref:type 4a pilus biogenesis protein PilO n=1 Tax=Limnobacter sp. TaxID=2003368 RepID=UPI0035194FD3